ncbi:MAG: transcription termination/antitermination NusG family protein [Streptococcus sp.]
MSFRKRRNPKMLDSFDKGWFVLQTYSGYENKVKENLCNVPKLITCLKISCVLKSQLKL